MAEELLTITLGWERDAQIVPSISGHAHDRQVQRLEDNIVNVVLIKSTDGQHVFSINTDSSESESFVLDFLRSANDDVGRPSTLGPHGTQTLICVSRKSPKGSHAAFSIQKISITYKDVAALKEAKAAKTVLWRTLDTRLGIWGNAAPSDDAMEVDSPIGSPTKSPALSAKEEESKVKFALATFTDIQQKTDCDAIVSVNGCKFNVGQKLNKTMRCAELFRVWNVNHAGDLGGEKGKKFSLTRVSEFLPTAEAVREKHSRNTLQWQQKCLQGWQMKGESNDRKFAYVVIGGKELKNIRLASVSSLHDGQFCLTLSQSDNSNMPREIWLTSGKKKTQQVKVYKFKGEGPSTEYPLNY